MAFCSLVNAPTTTKVDMNGIRDCDHQSTKPEYLLMNYIALYSLYYINMALTTQDLNDYKSGNEERKLYEVFPYSQVSMIICQNCESTAVVL
jgi:hypothetical protein